METIAVKIGGSLEVKEAKLPCNPLISVIIPVYKVEPYLRKCLDSVLAQTYANLQIILVDDGSPDNCGKICDEYAGKDKRIEVIHKENGGLSDARNAGLGIMKGEYVAFVDSDDWVLPKYIEDMYENLKKYNSDLAISGIAYFYEHNKEYKYPYNMKTREGVWNREQAINKLMYQNEFLPSAYVKLYKVKLFETIKYPKGMYWEDLATAYRLFFACDKISYLDDKNYFYVQRRGSILHKPSIKKMNDALDILDEMLKWIKENMPVCEKSAICRLVGLNFHIYHSLLKDKNEYRNEIARIEKNIKKYRYEIIFDLKIKNKIRIACLLSYLGFGILGCIFKLFKANGEI